MNYIKFLSVLMLLCLLGCKSQKPLIVPEDDYEISFKFVQLNDVYEIAPLSGGKYGGMSRVAHVVDSVKAVEPNTFLFMAGDFLNPSLLGTLKVDGERVKGKQMIEVMNAMNFELVTFGNHEFDLDQEELQQRMDESNFYWTSANVFQINEDGPRSFFFRRNNDSIYVPETYTISIEGKNNTKVDVGLFSVTLGSNPVDYVHYADPFLEASSAYNALKFQQAEVIVALTHLVVEDDIKLANQFPDIDLIMGGHEHNSMLVATDNAPIAKADANAKSIYIHTFKYNTKTDKLETDSHLMPIDDKISSKPEVKAIIDRWQAVLDEKIKEVISNPNEVIYRSATPLDGTDSANRSLQTNLGAIVTHAMFESFDTPVDGAIVNAGSFRVDDMLPGNVTSLDVFRVLPFGGSVYKVDITGSLLKEVLDFGREARGNGAYLQRHNFSQATNGEWLLNLQTIQDEEVYTIAMSDFLLKGYDIPFLTEENQGVKGVYRPLEKEAAYDIRKAVILFMKSINQ